MRGSVLCYALGGGLGHLQRITRFLGRRLPKAAATILTSSGHAGTLATATPQTLVRVPAELASDPASLRAWLAAQIAAADPDLILVDVFPCGLLGELLGFDWPNNVPRWHLARLLRWNTYRDDLQSATGVDLTAAPTDRWPRFDDSVVLEPLHASHQEFLDRISSRQESLDLFTEESVEGDRPVPSTDSWVVAHSGPAEEVSELVAYAREVQRLEGIAAPIRVATLDPPTELPLDCTLIADPFPATPHLATAARIVTAAGFNLIHETRAFRDRQLILPLPRRYDDQFERARRARLR